MRLRGQAGDGPLPLCAKLLNAAADMLINQVFGFQENSFLLEKPMDDLFKLVHLERLAYIVIGAGLECGQRAIHRRVTGQYDQSDLWISFTQLLKQFHPSHLRHFKIQYADMEPAWP